jgi:uncharacterized protein YjbI with pentapeptide repeats
MVVPQRAPVRPRVISPETGDAILLEDLVLAAEVGRAIEIAGDPGSGKTMALAHLAAVASADLGLVFFEDALPGAVARSARQARVVFASSGVPPLVPIVTYRLAPWGKDEVLEYLLAVHRAECSSVMSRLLAGRGQIADGPAELWRVVLDRMAEDDSTSTVTDALRREISHGLGNLDCLVDAEQYCLATLANLPDRAGSCFQEMVADGAAPQVLRLLRHPPVRLMLAADGLALLAENRELAHMLDCRLPKELVKAAGGVLSPDAITNLKAMVTEPPRERQPMAASLLHAAGTGWVPQRGRLPLLFNRLPLLSRAYLDGAKWPAINLSHAALDLADLSNSDLAGAKLDEARAMGTNFRGATLQRASLVAIKATGASFAGCMLARADLHSATLQDANLNRADLAGANLVAADLGRASLKRAHLHGADLKYADMAGATIAEADFSSADLRWAKLPGLRLRDAQLAGARFAHAHLAECDLEGAEFPEADFEGALLAEAYLTGSRMPRANFRGADLRGAGLADIQWEGADLRNATLRNCTFHLGSSRSGLVGSPVACEGSRTGFYGDDFDDRTYRAPEEIRKANLRGADLTGADVTGTDFYLVDLREARYTAEQLEHFRKGGAILSDRGS